MTIQLAPISYWCPTRTEPVSSTVFYFFASKYIWVTHDLDLSGSRDVTDHVTNRFAICHFLLVSLWNRTSIS